jgi:hypothetical protein
VVQSTQDWEGEDLATIVIWRDRLIIPFWNLLCDALMRSGSIEVLDISMKDTMQLLLLEDERVIETLSRHAAGPPRLPTSSLVQTTLALFRYSPGLPTPFASEETAL